MSYKAYLRSPHWIKLSKAAKERDGFRCQVCDDDFRLHVHHKFYRARHEDTELGDLITLCEFCHFTGHAALRVREATWPGKFMAVLRLLFEVF